jgi:hypothetical protein
MALPADYLRRTVYAKYLFRRASTLLDSKTTLAAGEAILLLQDSAEMLMRVVGDQHGVTNFQFPEFWQKIKEKTGSEPPLRNAMVRVNQARVAFKHHGTLPNPTVVRDFLPLVKDFSFELSRLYLSLDFEKLSLAELVSRVSVKVLVEEAEHLFHSEPQKSMEKLGLAFEELYESAKQDAYDVLARPPKPFKPRIDPSLSNIEDYIEEIAKDHERLANTVNMLLLGIDPRMYFYFRNWTPRFTRAGYQRMVVNTYWPKVPGQTEFNISDEVFQKCRDFLIEFSLRNDELF